MCSAGRVLSLNRDHEVVRVLVLLVVVMAVAAVAYVRLAPHDVAAVHVAVPGNQDRDMARGAIRIVPADDVTWQAALGHMADLPRTKKLAGDAQSGLVTYVTRSRVIGFPDYTTLDYDDGQLKAHARLRFGQSDLGVNRKRLEGLIAALQ